MSMPGGYQVLVRAASGLMALAVVAQCGRSPASDEAANTRAAAAVIDTSIGEAQVVDTTAPARTNPASTTATTAEPNITPAPVIDPGCPLTPHAAVIDRDRQRAWLCDHGVALPEFVVTTARRQPDPGTYPIYDKDLRASSKLDGHYKTMTHFVAFTTGEETGARIAFHTVPVLTNGEYVQPLESVGTEERHGDSAGCIRVLPEQGQVLWDWLAVGDEVRVVD
jgi:hypothetical protein